MPHDPIEIVGVNAYGEDLSNNVTVCLLRADNRGWINCVLPERRAVQLADMLYMLTKEGP